MSAARAMSVDEALLSHVCAGSLVLRLYRFERPSVSLGYRQPVPEWLDRARAGNLDVVRRPTGGGSVVHAGDLVYAVAAPLGLPGVPRSARGAYEWVRDAAASALLELGLRVEPARADPGAERASLCFAASTGAELALGGCKLLGSAQRRIRSGWLQHGSVRLRDDSHWYRDVLGAAAPEMPALPAGIEGAALERSLARAFELRLGCAPERGSLREEEEREARLRENCRRDAPLGCVPIPLRCH